MGRKMSKMNSDEGLREPNTKMMLERNIDDGSDYHPSYWDNPDYNIPDDCELA